MADAGKGSRRRPAQVTDAVFARNWQLAFDDKGKMNWTDNAIGYTPLADGDSRNAPVRIAHKATATEMTKTLGISKATIAKAWAAARKIKADKKQKHGKGKG